MLDPRAGALAVTICPGYALGPFGDEIYVPEPAKLDLTYCARPPCDPCSPKHPAAVPPAGTAPLLVMIKYSECPTRPMRTLPAGCGCDETACEYSRIRDGFQLQCAPKPQPPDDDDAKDLPPTICETEGDRKTKLPKCPPCPTDPWLVLATITLVTENGASGRHDRTRLYRQQLAKDRLQHFSPAGAADSVLLRIRLTGEGRWSGAPNTNRTCDLPLRRGLLYPLSYRGAAGEIIARAPWLAALVHGHGASRRIAHLDVVVFALEDVRDVPVLGLARAGARAHLRTSRVADDIAARVTPQVVADRSTGAAPAAVAASLPRPLPTWWPSTPPTMPPTTAPATSRTGPRPAPARPSNVAVARRRPPARRRRRPRRASRRCAGACRTPGTAAARSSRPRRRVRASAPTRRCCRGPSTAATDSGPDAAPRNALEAGVLADLVAVVVDDRRRRTVVEAGVLEVAQVALHGEGLAVEALAAVEDDLGGGGTAKARAPAARTAAMQFFMVPPRVSGPRRGPRRAVTCGAEYAVDRPLRPRDARRGPPVESARATSRTRPISRVKPAASRRPWRRRACAAAAPRRRGSRRTRSPRVRERGNVPTRKPARRRPTRARAFGLRRRHSAREGRQSQVDEVDRAYVRSPYRATRSRATNAVNPHIVSAA